jgi:hypothetical protein
MNVEDYSEQKTPLLFCNIPVLRVSCKKSKDEIKSVLNF